MILNHQKFDFQKKRLIEKITIQAPFRLESEFQNEACFIYTTEGKILFSLPTERLEINSHESILLNCGKHFADFMQKATTKTCEVYAVHLYPDILKEIYKNEIPSFIKESKTKQFAQKLENQNVIDHFIHSLTFYFENPKLVTDELLVLKLKELILLLIQTNNSESIIELISKIFTPRQANLKDIIQTHLFSNFSVEELSNLSNLSVSTFNRTFHNIFNDTPANYIKLKRLERAKELLSISSLTISEIAFQTCFNDMAHFSRSFKTAYKTTPSAFRLSQKKS